MTEDERKSARIEKLGQKSLPDSEHQEPNLTLQIHPELAALQQYRIVRQLGTGGMSVVYLAKNLNMGGRAEALKVLNYSRLKDPSARERFDREIALAASLKHPNIVTSYAALRLESLTVFSMEYLKGRNLQEFVDAKGPLSAGKACAIIAQVAAGLQHAFESKTIHRDIKPANLMIARVGDRDIIKIVDFGLGKTKLLDAKQAGLTGTDVVIGSPDYMAPEQSVSPSLVASTADIYSLGCTLYFLLTGHPPFRGTAFEVLRAHQSLEPTPLNVLRSEIPIELSAVVGKMLSKDRAKRFQCPAEVRDAILEIARSSPKAFDSTVREEDHLPTRQRIETSHAKQGFVSQLDHDSIKSEAALPRDPGVPPSNGKRIRFTIRQKLALFSLFGIGLMSLIVSIRWIHWVLTLQTTNVLPPQVARQSPTESTGEGAVAKTSESTSMHSPADPQIESRDESEVLPSHDLPIPEIVAEGEPKFDDGSEMVVSKTELPTDQSLEKPETPAKPYEAPNIDQEMFENFLGIKLILVKAGEFNMGTPESIPKTQPKRNTNEVSVDEIYGQWDEKLHSVAIGSDFYIGETEVTNAQFYEFLRQTGRMAENAVHESVDESLPIVKVSYDDAQQFCQFLNRNEQVGAYRLPTEAEWEYACRGGHKPPKSGNGKWSGDWSYEGAALRYSVVSTKDQAATLAQIRSKISNSLNLFDMHGNVWEWVQDAYDPRFYGTSPLKDPICNAKEITPDTKYCVRGGSFRFTPQASRSANRLGLEKSKKNDDVGFRIVWQRKS